MALPGVAAPQALGLKLTQGGLHFTKKRHTKKIHAVNAECRKERTIRGLALSVCEGQQKAAVEQGDPLNLPDMD